jgi:recombination protein RecT
MAKIEEGMFTQQPEPQPQPKQENAVVKKEGVNNLPDILKPLAAAFMAPKKAFISAGGTETKFNAEVNFAMQSLMNNSFLVDCAKKDPQCLVEAIKNVGLTGLTLNPELRLGYLVPFKGKIKFMSSYMGKIDILIRTGMVKSIYADLVYEKDKFVYRKGVNGTLEHYPEPFAEDRGEIKGGYYYAVLSNGQVMYDVMPKSRIDEIKNRSESVKKGGISPWNTDPVEMMKKTIINWAFKSLPKTGISEDVLKTIEAMNNFDNSEFEEWKNNSKEAAKDTFKDDEKFVPFEEVKDDTNQ